MSALKPAAGAPGLAEDLRAALGACRPSVTAVAVFSFAVNLLWLVPPLYMLQVYDRVLPSGSTPTLLMLSLIVLFLYVTMAALEWLRSQILVRIGERAHALLADRLYEVSFRQSLASGGQQSAAQPLQDLQGLRQFLTGPGLTAFFDAPWMPLYALVMFAIHPWYGWLCIVAALLLVGIAVAQERTTAPLLREANRHAAGSQAALDRTLRNAEAIEALGMLANLRSRWRAAGARSLGAQTLASERGGRLVSVSRVLRLLLQSAVFGTGAWLVLRGRLTPGLMIAGSILLGRALAPIDQLTGTWRGFVAAREQFHRLNELLQRLPPRAERMELPAPAGRVDVEAITVVPPGAQIPALRGISFAVAPGEIVGVIGPSAAGKSTLARALLGVWPAAQGRVRLDGADVYGWSRTDLGPHVGYLPQDVELFDGTVAENIARFGAVDAEQVVAAAQLAGVHAMILRLPQGYDTPISPTGGVLSGGQRQRIGLARAVYGTPKLVVLDEPNSNLDEAGDKALVSALLQLKASAVTVIVISHRSGLMPVMDKLAALNQGQLVAFGPREEVRRQLRGIQDGTCAAPPAPAGAPAGMMPAGHTLPGQVFMLRPPAARGVS